MSAPLTENEIAAIAAEVECDGWTFYLANGWLYVTNEIPDSRKPGALWRSFFRITTLDRLPTHKHVIEACLEGAFLAATHEVFEHFYVGGKRWFDPHIALEPDDILYDGRQMFRYLVAHRRMFDLVAEFDAGNPEPDVTPMYIPLHKRQTFFGRR